jgi:RHS repeat-associated protein
LLGADNGAGQSMAVAYDGRNRPVKRVTGPAILPVSAVSRKTHGNAGTFDLNLPLTGTPAIECRSGGASSAYQVVVTFPSAISFGSASVTTGTGTISSMSVNGDATEITINLTGVSNQQTIVISLSSVTDGSITNDVAVGMRVLIGDTNADGFTDAIDDSQTKSQSGNSVTSANFREDVNVDGFIDAIDDAFVKSKSGTALPSSPPLTQVPPTTYLIYDGWNLIAEFDANGNQVAKYYHGANTDEVLERVGSPANVYYHQDALGSVMRLTDVDGNEVEQYTYSVFGVPTINGSTISASAYGNRFMFTGREYFPELGLYDSRNRIYSPNLGRFLQTDPSRLGAKDVNMYRYVKNNPVNAADPFGLCPPCRDCDAELSDCQQKADSAFDSAISDLQSTRQSADDAIDSARKDCYQACREKFSPGLLEGGCEFACDLVADTAARVVQVAYYAAYGVADALHRLTLGGCDINFYKCKEDVVQQIASGECTP